VADGGDASFVALDPQDGNVIAAGVLPGTLTVVKLDAASGAVLWTSSLNGSFGAASAATLTNRGTVAVARGGTIREFDTTNGILAVVSNSAILCERHGFRCARRRDRGRRKAATGPVSVLDGCGQNRRGRDCLRSPLWSRRR
jgi:hypothetical protein